MIKSGESSQGRSASGSRGRGGRLGLSLMLAWALIIAFGGAVPAQAAGPTCVTKSPTGSYSVKVCLTVGSGTTLTGNVAVSATVSILPAGSSPGLRKLEFYLDGSYLITDFESPYAFTLPTASFLDGSHTVRADVLLRDNNTVSSAGVSATFANGTTSPPPPATGFTPTSGRPAAPGEAFVVAATGDGASGQKASDDVVNLIDSWNPNLFLYTGDVYEKGTETEFLNWYGPQGTRYGKFKSITNPIVGNHEYENGGAPGYFNYWSGVPDYYSYDAGGWHFIGLNSNSQINGFDPGSGQYNWLKDDLKNHQKACTMAYFHHPVLSVGPQGNTTAMNNIWKLLADNGVDVVLTGHEHQYQRWVPLDRDFNRATSGGMVEFVAGGGGHGIQSAVRMDSRVAAIADTTTDGFGALRMELSGGSMLYSYVNPGGVVRDSGSIACSGLPQDTDPPSVPGDVTATTSGNPDVTVAWSASTDNQGVASYDIRRGTQTVKTVPATQTTWLDTSTAPLTSYDYSVRATDATGNQSDWSAPVTVTTPDVQTSFTWPVSEDAYVDGAKPSSTLGTRPDLRVDASPVQRTYLKFQVTGVGTRAPTTQTLRVHAGSGLAAGFDVRAVPDNSWTEKGITYSNAPSVGALLATSGPVTSGSWVEIPVTGLISGDGTYTLALVARSTTALRLDARESGTSAQLLADTTGSSGNAPPVASDLPVTTDEDTAADWVPEVVDADGDTLTCSIDAPPAHGHATVADGCSSGTFTPDPNTNGSDSFTYKVSDGAVSATGTVTVTVNPVNDSPGAQDVSGSAWASSSTTLTLTATDIDGDCPMTFEVNPPEHGTLSQVGSVTCASGAATAQVTYIAAADWTGTDTLGYLARDPGGLAGQAQASVSVTSAPALFTVPASADTYVSDSAPTTNYGRSTALRVDGASPVQRSYVRFPVSGLGSTPPATLTLRLHAGSSLSAGFEVHASSGTWDEATLAWNGAPAPGELLAASGPVTSGAWVEIALPPSLLPTGDGTVDLTLTPLSNTALRLDARESTAAPQLVVSR